MNSHLFEKIITDININIKELNSHIACATEHRGQKLPWGFNEKDKRCKAMKKDLKNKVEFAINRDYHTFLCGMALGFDLIFAETILKLKRKYPHIKLIGAIPWSGQSLSWSDEQQKRYNKIIAKLDGICCLYDNYNRFCLHERNRYMVNNSSLIFALFDGQPGGTKTTLEYAKKQGLEILLIDYDKNS